MLGVLNHSSVVKSLKSHEPVRNRSGMNESDLKGTPLPHPWGVTPFARWTSISPTGKPGLSLEETVPRGEGQPVSLCWFPGAAATEGTWNGGNLCSPSAGGGKFDRSVCRAHSPEIHGEALPASMASGVARTG